MLKPGTLINHEYQIEALIGKGGMGSIYKARLVGADAAESPDEYYALKEIPLFVRNAAGQMVKQNIAPQIDIMRRIQHPGIARVVDVFYDQDALFLASEYIEGQSLLSKVYAQGAQDPGQVISWGVELCEILSYLHTLHPAVVYRDMKPSNVMVDPAGALHLVDMGIVREYKDAAAYDKDTVAFGTQGYAPPEQYGRAQTDARADIYALGCTLWHLLTGCVPPVEFPLPNVRSVNPDIDDRLAAVIAQCTRLDRTERYQTAREVAAALRRCQMPEQPGVFGQFRQWFQGAFSKEPANSQKTGSVDYAHVAGRESMRGSVKNDGLTVTDGSMTGQPKASMESDSAADPQCYADFFFTVVQSEMCAVEADL